MSPTYTRIEVSLKPGLDDSTASGFLKKIEMALPGIRKKIRSARTMDVFWAKLPLKPSSEVLAEIFQDPVLQDLNFGLKPVALPFEGVGIEKKFRPGVTDNVGKTALEAFQIVLGRSLPDAQVASGAVLWLEPEANQNLLDSDLDQVARQVFCNPLIEAHRVLKTAGTDSATRFDPAQVQKDFPEVRLEGMDVSKAVSKIRLEGLTDSQLERLSRESLWAMTLPEMQAIRTHFQALGRDPTDVEMEVLAQTWSEHCKHKIFAAEIEYQSSDPNDFPGASEIPSQVDGLFKQTILGTTKQISRPWLLSVFDDNSGILAFDEKDAFCIKVETHNSPSALDPYGGALTGIVGVNRDILGSGLGAKPIFNTNVFCVADPDYSKELPERLLHPRRILDGIRKGVEHGGNKSGIPTVNGALFFDDRYIGKPLVYCGTGGWMPRQSAGRNCELKEVEPGDRIAMVGGRIGKDGIHGATFSSLALDEGAPATAVQLGDPITQKRAADFILEARELGLYRAITDNGAGGLSSSVGEMARISSGAKMDVSRALTKYPGLKPFELVVSESQERMTLAVDPKRWDAFLELAARRGVEVSDVGTFTDSGKFEIFYGKTLVADLDLKFLHKGNPRLKLQARWKGISAQTGAKGEEASTAQLGQTLRTLLSRNTIASKEWLIRQYDHEVQARSVLKPLQQGEIGHAGSDRNTPNDAGVIQPKKDSKKGIVVGCGLNPRLSDLDAYWMAISSVDEAVRNVIAAGAEFGTEDSVIALLDNFCWPDPVSREDFCADLVRACYGLKEAALALQAPLVSGKDSMKNDYRGKLAGKDVHIAVPPTLLMTAVARVADVTKVLSADFKKPGDRVYRLGPAGENSVSLLGSEWARLHETRGKPLGPVLRPDWKQARALYSWLATNSKSNFRRHLRSLHDLSDGGLLVALSEGLFAGRLGLKILADAFPKTDLACFGEGLHGFIASIDGQTSASDLQAMQAEWKNLGIQFTEIGQVTAEPELVFGKEKLATTQDLARAFRKEGYWE
ncbi:MAG: phosphoribosylformylglycinamidine synthase [Bdellovibrionales bacterium]|nr:phosphoribosylformylglycinamidine synthase [Bdellovibrionales bacterium]